MTDMDLSRDFIDRTRKLLGEKEMDAFLQALDTESPVSIRLNRKKCMDAVPPQGSPVPWCESGFYLASRPTFTFDPLFHAGCYYVQEASSMILEQVLRQYVHGPVIMLDLCAAPGGKSTLARSILPEGSMLVANEVMRNRAQILAENLIKWGDPGVIVTGNDPADFAPLENTFDVILTDVPCSGEGMFRKDPVAVEEWSVENVGLCWQRQRRILRDIWNCLKPGGILIYSTCTYNREENEDNVRWISEELGADILPVDVSDDWHISGNLAGYDFPVYRFLPHHTVGEGLFMAVLRKSGEWKDQDVAERASSRKEKRGKGGGRMPVAKVPDYVKSWIKSPELYAWYVEGDGIVALPAAYGSFYERVKSCLRILHAGITVAALKGKDFVPAHALAMSVCQNPDLFEKAELTYEQAVSYLRKEAVVLPHEVPKGLVMVTYRQLPLGFVKNLGNRANNLYPQEWRIRSGYLPEQLVFPLDM